MTRPSDVGAAEAAQVAFTALEDAAEIFGLLSDPGRLRMLVALLDAEASVGALAASAGLSESGASHALRLLRAHRIVQPRRQGRMVHYRLADSHVRQLLCVALEHAAHAAPAGLAAPAGQPAPAQHGVTVGAVATATTDAPVAASAMSAAPAASAAEGTRP
jgi:DNA-binding transcriptional ArsR family regulator